MADFSFAGFADYTQAYRQSRTTPLEVAEALIAALATGGQGPQPSALLISHSPQDVRALAQQATARYSAGATLGPLDGVPLVVKDELDQAGYPTTVGTCFLGQQQATRDATAVSRLRAAGALLLGKANMHEIGIGVTGINPHHGTPRNPYDPVRLPGGSSSGSAAAVASGLCPGALGADGGGSVRIPAALCGVVGLKPTYGRVSEAGAAPLCWSVAHIGPIAASVSDAATLLSAIAGPDPRDPLTLGQPPLALAELEGSLAGLRLAWCPAWAERAAPEVRSGCHELLLRLGESGAEVVEVAIPHWEHAQPALLLTISVEMAASQLEHRQLEARRYGPDTHLLLEVAQQTPAVDYVRTQRVRQLIRESFCHVLEQVDAIITPTTAITAPPLAPGALTSGQADDAVLLELMAFSCAANLTGLPALSVPAGYDAAGLPYGLQIMGRWWEEATVLRIGLAAERCLQRRAPRQLLQPPLALGA